MHSWVILRKWRKISNWFDGYCLTISFENLEISVSKMSLTLNRIVTWYGLNRTKKNSLYVDMQVDLCTACRREKKFKTIVCRCSRLLVLAGASCHWMISIFTPSRPLLKEATKPGPYLSRQMVVQARFPYYRRRYTHTSRSRSSWRCIAYGSRILLVWSNDIPYICILYTVCYLFYL
jgi:hypothetical protein